jgi:small-conductance mechanosensitive channel
VDLRVGVAYGSDPRRVIELLLGCACAHPHVLAYPAPIALFAGFGESALTFDLRFWTGFEQFVAVRSEVGLAAQDALAAAGVAIPFSQHDLHLRSVTPAAASALSAAASSRNPGDVG